MINKKPGTIQASQTPLVDILRSIPADYRAEIELERGYLLTPLGKHCHDAAQRIEELERRQCRELEPETLYLWIEHLTDIIEHDGLNSKGKAIHLRHLITDCADRWSAATEGAKDAES